MMPSIQKIFRGHLQNMPKLILREFIDRKLQKQDILLPALAIDALVDHILAKKEEEFVWIDENEPDKQKHITLSFNAEDEIELESKLERVLASIPDTTQRIIDDSSKAIFKSIKKRWAHEGATQDIEICEFNSRLVERWREGLDLLRMLLTAVREVGHNTEKTCRRSRSQKHPNRRFVLLRLHVRACQVTDEIITLMSNGFADGAMARWRTLHEIEVVATIIADGDEGLAKAFIDHNIVEIKKQLDDWKGQNKTGGNEPIPDRQQLEIEDRYQSIMNIYGSSFRHDYGWASSYLNDKKPDFRNLQAAADQSEVFSYYKIANINIHAGSRSMFFSLSNMDPGVSISGRSNAGLIEPGQHTAFSLVRVTAALLGRPTSLDKIIEMKTLVDLRDAVPIALSKADRKLHREEAVARREYQRYRQSKAKKRKSSLGRTI